MAARTTPDRQQAAPERKSGYIEIPIPRLSVKEYKPNTINLALFLVLIVAAYLLGMLTTKVQYLEKGATGTQTAQAAVTDPNAAPQEPPALPPEEAKKIVEADMGSFPVLGNRNAKVKIVEYSDFQCPFCKRYFDDAFPQIKKDYIDTGKVAYIFKHYPLSFHANAQKAGEAAECVNELSSDALWEYHDTLFNNQTAWENQAAADAATSFATYAQEVGVSQAAFTTCLDSGKHAQKITDQFAQGQQAGVSGTPSIFVNGQLIVGAQPYASFKAAIDKALES